MQAGALTLRIDSRLSDVYLVGLSVRAIGAALQLDETAAGALELCVVEAVNNAIEHAYGDTPGHPVEVVVVPQPGALRVAVRDRGEAMDFAALRARATAAAAADPYAEGGRGLFIIDSLMDGVSYAAENGWNVLTLVKRLPVPEAAGCERRGSGLA